MPRPSLDDILAVCGRASFGELDARVEVEGDAQDELVVLAHALNILLGDLDHRSRALRESEAKFRRLADSNVIGVVVGRLDGQLLEANDAFLRMIGETRERLAAGALSWTSMTPPSWAQTDARALEQLRSEGRLAPIEKAFERADGTRVPVLIGGALLPESTDTAIAFVLDLTETHAARAALAASNERYRTLFERGPQPAYVFDLATLRFLDVNQAMERTYGWTKAEFAQMSVLDIRPEAERARLVDALLHLPDRVTRNGIWRHVRKDGTFLDVLVSSDRLDFEGRRARLVIVEDVTERLAAEAELAAARRQVAQSEKLAALGSLVSGVAHEIRTPLAYINNYANALEARVARGETSDLPAMAAEIRAGVERIQGLVSELARFTRRVPGERRRFPLHEPVREAVELFRATHRGKVEIQTALGPTPAIEGDAAQVQQVVLNLLQNGVDALPGGGLLRVATRVEGDGIAVLEVEDQGTGIPEAIRSRLFDPLFTTKPDGMGLGLSIVQRIAREHEATIEFRSESGKGTTFYVRFPVAAPLPYA